VPGTERHKNAYRRVTRDLHGTIDMVLAEGDPVAGRPGGMPGEVDNVRR
jgi:hypothetical protein